MPPESNFKLVSLRSTKKSLVVLVIMVAALSEKIQGELRMAVKKLSHEGRLPLVQVVIYSLVKLWHTAFIHYPGSSKGNGAEM